MKNTQLAKGIDAIILADSISIDGSRITTFLAKYPMRIHAELKTHGMLSTNSASTRAIPTKKMLQMVDDDLYIPEFLANQKGMQSGNMLDISSQALCKLGFKSLWETTKSIVKVLDRLGCHKSIPNTYLMPFSYITTLITATDWENFFALRAHKDAHPDFQKLAFMMLDGMNNCIPEYLPSGKWHMPFMESRYVANGFVNDETMLAINVARCARLSYMTHDGNQSIEDDLRLFDQLRTSGHWSPFEHVATPEAGRHGRLNGWKPYRKFFLGENKKDSRLKKYRVSRKVIAQDNSETMVVESDEREV